MSARAGKLNIPQAALEILQERSRDLDRLYEKPGGWEGWFQSELYLKLSETMVPLAETHEYTKKKLRADFGMTGSDGDIAIELKVESHWQTGTFVAAVAKDIEKVQELGDAGILLVVARETAKELAEGFRRVTVVGSVGRYYLLMYSPTGFFEGGL